MPFCANCGAAVEGRFCGKCGAPVAGAEQPIGGPAPPVATLGSGVAGLSDNLVGALCYLGLLITGILFLVLEPYSRNRAVRFHALQAIFLNVAWIAVWFAVNIVFAVIHILGFLSPLVWLAFLVLWVYMIVSTYQGKTVVLPVIGPLAQKQV